MLPFAIISNTKIPEKKFIKMTASEYSAVFSLIFNDKLYLSGVNDAYQLGDNTIVNKYNQWIKVPESDPIKVASTGYQQTIYVTTTGKVMITGNDVTETPTVSRRTFFDISSRFTSSIDTTKIVNVNIDRYGLFFILEDGSVWGCGTDNTGWMGLGSVPNAFVTFRKVYEGSAISCITGTGTSRILLQDGTVLSAGTNTYNQVDGSSTASIPQFTNSFPGVDPQLIYQHKLCNNNCIIYCSDKKYYCTGWASYGVFGNNNVTSMQYGTYIGTLEFEPYNLRQFMKLQCNSSSGVSFVISSTGQLYSCGFQSTNLISSTVSYGKFTLCQQNQTYIGMRFLSGSANSGFYDPNTKGTTMKAAFSSLKTTTPTVQSNVPTIGMGAVLPLILP